MDNRAEHVFFCKCGIATTNRLDMFDSKKEFNKLICYYCKKKEEGKTKKQIEKELSNILKAFSESEEFLNKKLNKKETYWQNRNKIYKLIIDN